MRDRFKEGFAMVAQDGQTREFTAFTTMRMHQIINQIEVKCGTWFLIKQWSNGRRISNVR